MEKLFECAINSLSNREFYKAILNKGNNLYKYDLTCRVLILYQCRYAFDVRSEDEWLCNGRSVLPKSKPIQIMIPKYSTVYRDVDTNSDISSELNAYEMKKALEYQLVYKESSLIGVSKQYVYDIRQTRKINNLKSDISKPLLNKRVLIDIAKNILDCDVVQSDSIKYQNNILYVCNTDYNNMASCITNIIVNKIAEIENETQNKLFIQSLQYSISTLLISKYDADIECNNANICELINIIYKVDDILDRIIGLLDFNDNNAFIGAYHSIEITKKAQSLLNLIESNTINKLISDNL